MNLEGLYSSEFLGQIKQFPVWRPGDDIEPGDIGDLKDGVFIRQTTLGKVFPDLTYKVTKTALRNPYRFVSTGCKVGKLNASAARKGAAAASAQLKIDFSSKGGVVFAATHLQRRTIEDLHRVRQYIKDHRALWPKGGKLAGAVERAGHFRVVISESKGGSLALSGKAKALGVIDIADAGVSASMENAAGYDSEHASGTIAATLYGFGWRWWPRRDGVQLLEYDAAREEVPDFTELKPSEYPGEDDE